MKIRSLAIVATAFIVTAVATPALAMYHPGMGRFLQRDPHGTMNAPAASRVGMAGPAATGGFVARDPMPTRPQPSLQYADGMNLYQYVGSQPTMYVDPSGLRRQVIAFEGLGGVSGISYPFVQRDWGRPVLIQGRPSDFHYYAQDDVGSAFTKAKELATQITKDPDPGDLCYDTLIIIGFSNGGAAADELEAMLAGENIKVDLIFTADPIPKGTAQLSTNFEVGGNTTKWVNYYQTEDRLLKGHKVDGATNRRLFRFDFDEPSKAHTQITGHPDVLKALVSHLTAVNERRKDWRWH